MLPCVFTIIVYLPDEESLVEAIHSAARALKECGYMLMDIPYRQIFGGFLYEDELLRREVVVEPKGGDIYRYRETIELHGDGSIRKLKDEFDIRYWPFERIVEILEREGFEIVLNLDNRFAAAGSHYLLLRKKRNPNAL